MPRKILLTDITHHTRAYRPTNSFFKVADKGRMYVPPPKFSFDEKSGKTIMTLSLPQDLMRAIEKNLVELVAPEGYLLVLEGQDMVEKLDSVDRKNLNQAIHQSRAWHSDKQS